MNRNIAITAIILILSFSCSNKSKNFPKNKNMIENQNKFIVDLDIFYFPMKDLSMDEKMERKFLKSKDFDFFLNLISELEIELENIEEEEDRFKQINSYYKSNLFINENNKYEFKTFLNDVKDEIDSGKIYYSTRKRLLIHYILREKLEQTISNRWYMYNPGFYFPADFNDDIESQYDSFNHFFSSIYSNSFVFQKIEQDEEYTFYGVPDKELSESMLESMIKNKSFYFDKYPLVFYETITYLLNGHVNGDFTLVIGKDI